MDSDILEDWNPWWIQQEVPKILLGKGRKIIQKLYSLMDLREILIISGIRRAGKTTLMYQLIDQLLKDGVSPKNILFVNVEDPRFMEENLKTIISAYRQRFSSDGKMYVFLDEIQEMNHWEQWVKSYYERRIDIKFIISGSNSALLIGEYATLLTGRNITMKVFPFAFDEYLTILRGDTVLKDTSLAGTETSDRMIHYLEDFLEHGGFPEPLLRENALFSSVMNQYFQDIIYRDVIYRHRVNPKKVTKLALHLVTNSGNPMSMRKLRNVTGLSFDSLNNFLEYFEEAFLLKKVDAFSFSTQTGLSNQLPRKYYCADTGLRNAIAHRFSMDLGRNAENVVAIELWRRGILFNYWMGRGGKGEVDFAYLNDEGNPVGINVSYANTIEDREIKGLKEFASAMKGNVDQLLLLTKNVNDEIDSGYDGIMIKFVPLWKWLLGEQ